MNIKLVQQAGGFAKGTSFTVIVADVSMKYFEKTLRQDFVQSDRNILFLKLTHKCGRCEKNDVEMSDRTIDRKDNRSKTEKLAQ